MASLPGSIPVVVGAPEDAILWRHTCVTAVSRYHEGSKQEYWVIYLKDGSKRRKRVPNKPLCDSLGEEVCYATSTAAERDNEILRNCIKDNNGNIASFIPQNSLRVVSIFIIG